MVGCGPAFENPDPHSANPREKSYILLAVVTDLSGLLLAVLGVVVLLNLLGTSLHLQFSDLLRFNAGVLLLSWEGEDVGDLFAIPVHISLTNLARVCLGMLLQSW